MALPQRDVEWTPRAHIDMGDRLRITVEVRDVPDVKHAQLSARPTLLEALWALGAAVVRSGRVPRLGKRPGSQSDDTTFHGDGYSVRRLSREESRRAGLEGYEPQIVARQQSTDEFLAFLDTIPSTDDVAPAARPAPHANP